MLLTQIFPGYHEAIAIYQKVTLGLASRDEHTDPIKHKNVTERTRRFTSITGNIRIFQIYKYQNFIFPY